MSRKFDTLFDSMDVEKELWMKDYSLLVDCVYVPLNNEGIVKNA